MSKLIRRAAAALLALVVLLATGTSAAPQERAMSTSPGTYSVPFAARANAVYRWSWIGYASHATGTVAISAQPYDKAGAAVGSPLALYSGAPAAGKNTFAGNSPTMPVTTTQVVLRGYYTNSATGRTLDLSAAAWEAAGDLSQAKYVWTDDNGDVQIQFVLPLGGDVQIEAPQPGRGLGLYANNDFTHGIKIDPTTGRIQLTPANRIVKVQAAIQADDGYQLPPMTAPGSPPSGYWLYTDTADGKLKAKDSAGLVTTLVPPPITAYNTTIGDGVTTTFVVTHNLDTQNVWVSVYAAAAPYGEVQPTVRHTSHNTITLIFATAPTTNQYIVAVGSR